MQCQFDGKRKNIYILNAIALCGVMTFFFQRNGADFAVFVNTGQEFDGSDSGARPDEAISWGKIKTTSSPVKVYTDATLVFPLIVAKTFAKVVFPIKK